MSREKPKKIKVSVGSRIFDTVNLIFLILLAIFGATAAVEDAMAEIQRKMEKKG